jgi:hypothetical protein
MPEPLEGSYFIWLCAKVKKTRVNIYDDLLRLLHQTEFFWVIPEDENRAMDGLELRDYFVRETRQSPEPDWAITGCSVLEMLIAFAHRAMGQTGGSLEDWFWRFMTNLELADYRQVSRSDVSVIQDILHTFVWRIYRDDGDGGLFPMRWPKCNQLEIELADQLFQYIDEQRLIY